MSKIEMLHFKGSINEDKRKIYKKACKIVEISSSCFYIGYMKIALPISTIPYLFMSYFKYYTTDLEKDAFSLPFVMLYVEHSFSRYQ